MSSTLIDMDLLELGDEQNPFDQLMSRIEKYTLEGNYSEVKDNIEKTVLFLERKYQDFSEHNDDKYKFIYQAVLANVMILDSGSWDQISDVTQNLENVRDLSLGISNDEKFDLTSLNLATVLKEKFHSKTHYTSTDIQFAFDAIYHSTEKNIITSDEEWMLELNFNVERKDSHKPLEFIHTLIESLNSVDNVVVTLEDIKVGSLNVKLKMSFGSQHSKNEVKEILEDVRKLVERKLESKGSEAIADTEGYLKTDSDANTKFQQLDGGYEEEQELKALNRESLIYDIERKKLENEHKKLLLFKERKAILRDLLVEGIITQKNFEFLIKGLPFLEINDGSITIGESISVIDDL